MQYSKEVEWTEEVRNDQEGEVTIKGDIVDLAAGLIFPDVYHRDVPLYMKWLAGSASVYLCVWPALVSCIGMDASG